MRACSDIGSEPKPSIARIWVIHAGGSNGSMGGGSCPGNDVAVP
jgi:hypothetical protein